MNHSRHLILALACASSCILQAQSPDETHKAAIAERTNLAAAAKSFCIALRSEPVEGLPSVAQLQRLSPLITKELGSLIERARSRQQEQIRKHPDDKPDWIEGDLFSSLFEGVTTWELGSAFTAPEVDATVKVKQTYTEKDQKPVTWTDTLIFKQRDQKWLLDDIRMGGDWAFKAGQTLRGRLPGGIKETQDHNSPDDCWRIAFKRDGNKITRITVTDLKGRSKPMNLFGDDPKQVCRFPTWIIWSPDCDKLAIRLGDSPRFARTLIYRLVGSKWVPVAMPAFYPEEKKTMAANGFRERDSLVEADHWNDASTLVVHYFGNFTNGDDGDGFDKLISVHINEAGKASIVSALDTPGDN